MSNDKIGNNEIDLLSNAVDRIVNFEVLQLKMNEELPMTDSMADSNTVYRGKASVLFVDIRKSTTLPARFNDDELVKIYRSYIRTVVQAIRYSGGVVKDFMGDGALAIFVDDQDNCSEEKAVRAARYITTAVEMVLNPVLDKAFNYRISCGIGIYTGKLSVSKVGMRGKEQQDDIENEFGLAWIGNCTNMACKFSGTVSGGAILISPSTFEALSEKQMWRNIAIQKNGMILAGYIAEHYYLNTDDESKPYSAHENNDDVAPYSNITDVCESFLANIKNDLIEIGKREERLKQQQESIEERNKMLDAQEKELLRKKLELDKDEFDFYYDVLSSGFCKKPYVIARGKDFWEDNYKSLQISGKKRGYSEEKIKQIISCVMVSIYSDLELYEKAYVFLIAQAKGCTWLHLFTVQSIVNSVCSRTLKYSSNHCNY